MTDSITGPHLFANNSNIATPHETEAGQVSPVPHARTSAIGPATSIYSSAADMAKWLIFQLNNGKINNDVLIPEQEMEMLRRSHQTANFEFPGIAKQFIQQGLGLLISDSSSGHKLYSYGGDAEGLESYHAFLPEIGLGIAVMINSTKVMPQPLIAWIIDRFTNAPNRDWVNEQVPIYMEEPVTIFSELEQKRIAITDPSKSPSQSIASYAGHYQHPLLGDLRIEADSEQLTFKLGTAYSGVMLHANRDTFYIKLQSPHLGRYFFNGPAQFRFDTAGRLHSVVAVDREFKRVDTSEVLP
jgi:hypothetical protein